MILLTLPATCGRIQRLKTRSQLLDLTRPGISPAPRPPHQVNRSGILGQRQGQVDIELLVPLG